MRGAGRRDLDGRHPGGGCRRERPACWCPIEQVTDGSGTPLDPAAFEADLASALSELLADPQRAASMGVAGRRRAIEAFSWAAIATRTLDLYRTLL